jgi:hypothetical protein
VGPTGSTLTIDYNTRVITAPFGWNIAFHFVFVGHLCFLISQKRLQGHRMAVLALGKSELILFPSFKKLKTLWLMDKTGAIGFVLASLAAGQTLYRADYSFATGGFNTVAAGNIFMLISYFAFIFILGADPSENLVDYTDLYGVGASNKGSFAAAETQPAETVTMNAIPAAEGANNFATAS